jgi:hypothetical protein
MPSFFDSMGHKRVLKQWDRQVQDASDMDIESLRELRSQAKQIKRKLDRFNHIAESRLTAPVLKGSAIKRHAQSDWAHRPQLWTGPIDRVGVTEVPNRTQIGEGASIFHDCTQSEMSIRQVRNHGAEDLAPFGLRLDVFGFQGSFVSLVLDLPAEACNGLKRDHLIRLETTIEFENPIEVFARLNLKYGPNTEQVVRELNKKSGDVYVEFDLAYTDLNERRVEAIWLDLIFEDPAMNQILLKDVTLSRRPRAPL